MFVQEVATENRKHFFYVLNKMLLHLVPKTSQSRVNSGDAIGEFLLFSPLKKKM